MNEKNDFARQRNAATDTSDAECAQCAELRDRCNHYARDTEAQAASIKAMQTEMAQMGKEYGSARADIALLQGSLRSEKNRTDSLLVYLETERRKYNAVTEQTGRLAAFILDNFPGEPSFSGSAVDCAIALLTRYKALAESIAKANLAAVRPVAAPEV